MRRAAISVATLNTRGLVLAGSRLRQRYRAIGAAFEDSTVDLVAFQEVPTYHHLRLLTAAMPSFSHVAYRRWLPGPAGGLVTVSRASLAGSLFRRFPGVPPGASTLPRRTRLAAALKGCLVALVAEPGIAVINIHPVANLDGDWSEANRFQPLQRRQLEAAAALAREFAGPVVMCGDFNVARTSPLFAGFLRASGLVDAFEGRCPATFHAEYLDGDRSPQCIDFILLTGGVRAEESAVLFADKLPLPAGPAHVSDHVGLLARLAVTATPTGG